MPQSNPHFNLLQINRRLLRLEHRLVDGWSSRLFGWRNHFHPRNRRLFWCGTPWWHCFTLCYPHRCSLCGTCTNCHQIILVLGREVHHGNHQLLLCPPFWRCHRCLLHRKHIVVLPVEKHRIPAAPLLALLVVNTSLAKAGVLIPLQLVNRIVHQGIVEDPSDTNSSKSFTSKPVTFLNSHSSNCVITSFKQCSR